VGSFVDLGTCPPTPPPPPLLPDSTTWYGSASLPLCGVSLLQDRIFGFLVYTMLLLSSFFLYAGCFKDPSLDVLCDLSSLGIGLAEWLLLTGGWWVAKNSRCGSCDIYPFRFLFVGMVGCWNLLLSRVLQHQRRTRFLLSAEVSFLGIWNVSSVAY
jgi:hypothetical protein